MRTNKILPILACLVSAVLECGFCIRCPMCAVEKEATALKEMENAIKTCQTPNPSKTCTGDRCTTTIFADASEDFPQLGPDSSEISNSSSGVVYKQKLISYFGCETGPVSVAILSVPK